LHVCPSRNINSRRDKVLGVSDEEIATDYGLTAVGIAPAAPLLAGRLMQIPMFRENPQGTLNMGSSKYVSDILKTLG
jgi:hypothetical protein